MSDLELLPPREAARRLGVSVERVRHMCTTGELPAARVGSRWRVVWPLALRNIMEKGGVNDADAR
ncbi:hypothetical protein TPY_0412 [Sulfobacillus acidophilus TPY]|uniref:Helix-turn-helix domain-containing protein n=1 Tax=Sulfobacillus acidophilus (strain ATCC 700253 / DSM 10332 / NAL) TaxID=679936 RepID=G8TY38_SULAD|nr:hypothetical protein TPY_0412 [Sulfobacillus acidophilus TPY]AEW03945.1 hypothetical protein Sulac_0377 [Sulfobacillus acidophilus DSM 10332]